jgi:hypothetical protein
MSRALETYFTSFATHSPSIHVGDPFRLYGKGGHPHGHLHSKTSNTVIRWYPLVRSQHPRTSTGRSSQSVRWTHPDTARRDHLAADPRVNAVQQEVQWTANSVELVPHLESENRTSKPSPTVQQYLLYKKNTLQLMCVIVAQLV